MTPAAILRLYDSAIDHKVDRHSNQKRSCNNVDRHSCCDRLNHRGKSHNSHNSDRHSGSRLSCNNVDRHSCRDRLHNSDRHFVSALKLCAGVTRWSFKAENQNRAAATLGGAR